jgi:hypothetical protein
MGRKWIRGLFFAWFILALVLLAGCGKDGIPGNSYLGVWMEYSVADEIYYMSCSALPTSFTYGLTWYGTPQTDTVYYKRVGTWDYRYQLRWYDTSYHYSVIWYGSLTISKDPGEEGGFLCMDGEDGVDRYYDWVLGWNGSTISYDKTQSAYLAAPALNGVQLSVMEAPNKSLEGTPQPPDPALYDIGPTRVVTKSDGVYHITITEYPCSLKGTTPALPKSSVLKATR